jgi:hypothetical protein
MFKDSEMKELSKFGRTNLIEAQIKAIDNINDACKAFMEIIFLNSPSSADQSAAIRSARLAAMQANAATAWDWPTNKID